MPIQPSSPMEASERLLRTCMVLACCLGCGTLPPVFSLIEDPAGVPRPFHHVVLPSAFLSGSVASCLIYADVRNSDMPPQAYTARGRLTCLGRAGSLYKETEDARRFAVDWGVDYVKEVRHAAPPGIFLNLERALMGLPWPTGNGSAVPPAVSSQKSVACSECAWLLKGACYSDMASHV